MHCIVNRTKETHKINPSFVKFLSIRGHASVLKIYLNDPTGLLICLGTIDRTLQDIQNIMMILIGYQETHNNIIYKTGNSEDPNH